MPKVPIRWDFNELIPWRFGAIIRKVKVPYIRRFRFPYLKKQRKKTQMNRNGICEMWGMFFNGNFTFKVYR